MIGHGGLLRAFSFARPIRTAGDLGFAVQFNAETRGISRSSAILGSDSPQSNNRKGNSMHSRKRPNANTRYCRLFKATTAYTSTCTDAGAALAPLLSGGTRVRYWQSARRLWPDTRRLQQLPLDDCCRLVLPYNAEHSIQQTKQIPDDPPRMGTKSTTTSNHPSTPMAYRNQNKMLGFIIWITGINMEAIHIVGMEIP